MNISTIDTRYVGRTTDTAHDVGHDVTCVNIKAAVVDKLGAGVPSLREWLKSVA